VVKEGSKKGHRGVNEGSEGSTRGQRGVKEGSKRGQRGVKVEPSSGFAVPSAGVAAALSCMCD
jgi:hypothetical protein